VAAATGLAAPRAAAQQVIEVEEDLDFDRPESWAMKYFASVALASVVRAPEPLLPGAVVLGFEGGYVPQLSDEQRRVGFNGTKLEDVNKTKFFGRVRGDVGLPGDFAIELGYVPPVEVNGGTPHFFSAGLARVFSPSPSWGLGLRGYGQVGVMKGDITCSADEVAGGSDPDLNPFLCEAPSDDRLEQRVFGASISLSYGAGPWRPYVGAAVNYLDLEFKIDARYSGVVDRTVQTTSGGSVALTGGLTYAPSTRWRVGAELFYSPLSVVRPPSTSTENDGLLNARFFITIGVRS
jgi:hypothetical protein